MLVRTFSCQSFAWHSPERMVVRTNLRLLLEGQESLEALHHHMLAPTWKARFFFVALSIRAACCF